MSRAPSTLAHRVREAFPELVRRRPAGRPWAVLTVEATTGAPVAILQWCGRESEALTAADEWRTLPRLPTHEVVSVNI